MFPKTLCEHIEFHLTLWEGVFRVWEELLSWPRAVNTEIFQARMRYSREKEESV